MVLPTMRRPAIFIAFFLLIQAALPLHYYLVREDKHDERFAWRMFSTVRMLQCKPSFAVGDGGATVNLPREFHQAWLTLARRGRIRVVESMARALCDRNPGQPVYVQLTCRGPGQNQASYNHDWNFCSVGAL